MVPETEVKSEDSAVPHVLTSATSALLRTVSAATNEDVPELTVLESNAMD